MNLPPFSPAVAISTAPLKRVLALGILGAVFANIAMAAPVQKLPASVEELPIDRFDEYQAGGLPPYPWVETGTAPQGVKMQLLAEGETPFAGNKGAGKGLVMSDESAQAGRGYGIQCSFTPPPPGPVYLGFDFKLNKPEEARKGLDLACELTGSSGGGLSLYVSGSGGLSVQTASGQRQNLGAFSPGVWYHLGITISEKNEVSFVTCKEGWKEKDPYTKLGTATIAPAAQYTTLRFTNGGGNEQKGGWVIDNVSMGGKVDADRAEWLPFKQLPSTELRKAKPKVFCYYYPIYPTGWSSNDPGLSWFVRTTFNASSKVDPRRADAGTKLFYHPLVRPPMRDEIPKEEQLILAMVEEVRIGIQNGLDGFVVDFFSYPRRDTKRYNDFAFALMEAAHRVDPAFKIIPAIYATSPEGEETDQAKDPLFYAHSPVFEQLAKCPSVCRTDDGRMLISMWMTERRTPEWWKTAMDELTRRNIPTALVTQFNSKNQLAAFSPIVYAMSNWGQRVPSDEHWIELARQHSNVVVAPVASHDIRSRGCIFWESKNFDTVRKTWQLAIDGKADWVCLNTWSDYSEQAMAPSTAIGFALYDLNTYYGQWFKTGVQPAITHDVLYYSYRRHHSDLQPEKSRKWGMVKNGGIKTPSNEVELLGFLKQPGELRIKIDGKVYTQKAAAGITSFKVPLPPGKAFVPEFSLARDGRAIIDHKGQYSVLDKIEYGNMLYHSGVLTAPADRP